MRNAVKHVRRHARLLLLVLPALAAAALLLAATGEGSDPSGPQIACGGPDRAAYEISGQVPADVREVYVSYASGASVEGLAVHGTYRILIAARGPAGTPDELLYVTDGVQHHIPLDSDRIPDCPTKQAVIAGPPTVSSASPPPVTGTPKQRALALANAATIQADQTAPECRLNGRASLPRPTYSDGVPERAMLDLLGVLRRATTREELTAPAPIPLASVWTIYRRYRRIIHIPDAPPISIAVGVGHQWVPPQDRPPCRHKGDQALKRLLHGQPREVRRIAWKFRHSFRLGRQTRGQHPWLEFMGVGGTGGMFDAKSFRTHGLMIVGSGVGALAPHFNPRAPDARARVRKLRPHWFASGLVPDGVAAITIKRADASTILGTGKVIENAFAIRMDAVHLMPPKLVLIWRDANGRVIRTVR